MFQEDSFHYRISEFKGFENGLTKRNILSDTSQTFDPLGLLAPVIIKAKIFLQQLWKCNLTWDEIIPSSLSNEWTHFRKDLTELNNLRIPRKVIINNPKQLELHAFSDASTQAYGACIYIRSVDENNKIETYLLCSKTRVAPLKLVTIPRLELCGALVMARLAQQVIKALEVSFDEVVFWTDSTIVLGWIKTSPTLLKPFVSNRVAEIQEVSASWKHVPTECNPADLLSRGISPSNLENCSLWWDGPSYLKEDKSLWPNFQCIDINLPEFKKDKISLTINLPEIFPFENYSKLTKLQRIIAYCLRFIHNCTNTEKRYGPLTVTELDKSLFTLIKLAQQEYWQNEITALSRDKPISTNSKILSLNPFLDSDGLLRVGGRLSNSDQNYDAKFPILLPGNHKFTQLVFEREHIRLMHGGPQILLNTVRERFWPTSGRSVAKKVVRSCIKCFRTSPRTTNQIMGNLPHSRVTQSLPFSTVGIDYAGPIAIKDRTGRGAKPTKAYICLFVCFSTKAIHLDLVTDLTTKAFIMCLRRFIARRGKPTRIYSDNGLNFVGANAELKRLYKFINENENSITDVLSTEGIKWHFIPPKSPHFGGIWEAGVKSAKSILKKSINSTLLTFEDMYSSLVQIEAILNSRPLTPLSNDPHDFRPLSPAHFLIGRSLLAMPDTDVKDVPENRLEKFQRIQRLQQIFWRRWHAEYLCELQRRVKWKTRTKNLKPGMMVLLRDDNSPPLQWRMGRIEEVIPGPDGIIRVVNIRTPTGSFKRATSKVYPLPMEST